MTVVAFGTSTPELVVSIVSATQGPPDWPSVTLLAPALSISVRAGLDRDHPADAVEPSLITREIR
jgi:hypothetical protein